MCILFIHLLEGSWTVKNTLFSLVPEVAQISILLVGEQREMDEPERAIQELENRVEPLQKSAFKEG